MAFVDILLNVYNISIAVLVAISSFIDLFRFTGFDAVVLDLYMISAAVIIVLLETVGSPRVVALVPILKMWFGRGILYILLGVLCVGQYVEDDLVFSLVAGIIVSILGVFSIVFHFLQLPMSTPFISHWNGQHVALGAQDDFTDDSLSWGRSPSHSKPYSEL